MARLVDQINVLSDAIKAQEDTVSKKEKELSELKAKLSGMREAMDLMSPPEKAEPVKRSGLKVKILDMLDEVGADGLNSTIAVQMAADRGDEILRGSVSSLLSKMVKSDVVFQHDGRYLLRKYETEKRIETPKIVTMSGMSQRTRNI